MYTGLPIMTNKVTVTEMCGIPHHLLGHVSLRDTPWTVDNFRREAIKLIDEIRDRGNLPIVVGGTNYYVDALLFSDVILEERYPNDEPLPVLEESTEFLFQELKKVDPKMALQWHPNDRRKIMKSLEIYLRTGRRASDIYAEQQERRSAGLRDSPWQNLLFWAYSDREVLKARLDARVDKMLEAGLMDEVRELLDFKREEEGAGRAVDLSRGIWQSIGYKQLEPYVLAQEEGKTGEGLEQLRITCVEEMKAQTRQYAKEQIKWTRRKGIARLVQEGPEAVDSLYVLDTTDVSRFRDTAVETAARLTEQFLRGEPRTHPEELSELARTTLSDAKRGSPERTPCDKTCDVCGITVTTEERWKDHLRSRMHRARWKKKKRLAVVPVEDAPQRASESEGETSEPDVASVLGWS
jgi:tRNA dimethylallyltransferase